MKDYPAIAVAIAKDGRLHLSPSQKKRINTYVQKHDGQYVRLSMSQPTKGRSNYQNRYYWGVVLEILASETGHTTEEMHEFMKAEYLPRQFMTLAGKEHELVKSTTTLSTVDFEDYLENIRSFAARDLGIKIPMPKESM